MSHAAHQLYVHITWCTEQRLALIDKNIRKYLNEILIEACSELGYQIVAFEAVADHVHLLVRFKPTSNLAEFIKTVKGRSSRLISARLGKPFEWRKGYSITTVGPKALQIAIQYIKDQEKHHLDHVNKT